MKILPKSFTIVLALLVSQFVSQLLVSQLLVSGLIVSKRKLVSI